MKGVEELDGDTESASLLQNYWVPLTILAVAAVCGILAVLICWYKRCRQVETYAYTALEPDTTVHDRMEIEKKVREEAGNICCQYLKTTARYKFMRQLNDIGSRFQKHWFIVWDFMLKTERLLTLLPRGSRCPVEGNDDGRELILDFFFSFQHPYIYPILDVNFQDIENNSYVFITLPLNKAGSLKDVIYESQWSEDWNRKYAQKGPGLPNAQVQRLGRQILEALLFLKRKGFPSLGHFHSGNIIVQDGVARLSGLENTALGFTSRTHPILWNRAQSEPLAIDSLCFGHVLFEMCAGYELNTPKPTPGDMFYLYNRHQAVEVLEFIFENPKMRLPTIEEILTCDFFRNIDLREVRNQIHSTPVFQTHLTDQGVELLRKLRRNHRAQLKKFQVQTLALPYFDADAPDNSQQEKSADNDDSEQDVDHETCSADAYVDSDTNTSSDSETVPCQEHRCLSLYYRANMVLPPPPLTQDK